MSDRDDLALQAHCIVDQMQFLRGRMQICFRPEQGLHGPRQVSWNMRLGSMSSSAL